MKLFARLFRCTRAGSSAEFALVLPLLIVLLFGIIDTGRFMWEYNRAEKATQMGVRFAVVANLVPSGLAAHSFSILDGVPQGEPVPTANFDHAICDNADCATCVGSVCGTIGYDNAAFNAIVTRMHLLYPQITASNVTVEYRNVGLGFAGNPDGPDVSALVTVQLRDLNYHPITCLVFGCSISMPNFRAALTLEDADGDVSN